MSSSITPVAPTSNARNGYNALDAYDAFESLLASVIDGAVEAALQARTTDAPVPEALLDAQGAADLLALSRGAVEMQAKRGNIPSIVMPNRRRRFEREALLAWAKGQQ